MKNYIHLIIIFVLCFIIGQQIASINNLKKEVLFWKQNWYPTESWYDYTGSPSMKYGDNIYLNGYKMLFDSDEDAAYKLNPALYQEWAGYASPVEHRRWLNLHAR